MKYTELTIKIELENDAMQLPRDVALTLHKLANDLMDKGWGVSTRIKDINGNTVGKVTLK